MKKAEGLGISAHRESARASHADTRASHSAVAAGGGVSAGNRQRLNHMPAVWPLDSTSPGSGFMGML